MKSNIRDEDKTPVHDFFGLSYANYLVLPRSLLQSCTPKAQKALCDALDMIYEEEKANMPQHWPSGAKIIVQLQDAATGRFVKDPLANYERGRRKLWRNGEQEETTRRE
jgi:hypothetical protein